MWSIPICLVLLQSFSFPKNTFTLVYTQNINDFAVVNKIYATYFNENPPARACVEVSKMAKDALVEIDAFAAIN